jgi:hypothetical protein
MLILLQMLLKSELLTNKRLRVAVQSAILFSVWFG